MSHHRDRVVLTAGLAAGGSLNIPQLPSGKRAANNIPAIKQSTTATGVIVALSSINLSADLGTLVPTETKTATTP